MLAAVTESDLSEEAFPPMTARSLTLGDVHPVWAHRTSPIGEPGWELFGQFAMGQRAWDLLMEAGRAHGILGLTDDLDVAAALEQAPIAFAHHRVVVDEQHRDGALAHAARPTSGRHAVSRTPRPGSLAMLKRPPSIATRSSMPLTPKPLRCA